MEQKQNSDVVQIMDSGGRLQSGEKTMCELLAEYPCRGVHRAVGTAAAEPGRGDGGEKCGMGEGRRGYSWMNIFSEGKKNVGKEQRAESFSLSRDSGVRKRRLLRDGET